MPIRGHDPFQDILAKIDVSKNPFAQKFLETHQSKSLPIFYGPELRFLRGRWREQFVQARDNCARPLVLEIGCHEGQTICDIAKDHPETLFVGMDITFKRVHVTAERAVKAGLSNVITVLANAAGLKDLFAESELQGLVTFFPDPWVKKKHEHHRLYSPQFCAAAWDVLSTGSFLWLRTDQKNYFDNSCEYADQQGFSCVDRLDVLRHADYSSPFLRRFELRRLPWYERKWLKPLS